MRTLLFIFCALSLTASAQLPQSSIGYNYGKDNLTIYQTLLNHISSEPDREFLFTAIRSSELRQSPSHHADFKDKLQAVYEMAIKSASDSIYFSSHKQAIADVLNTAWVYQDRETRSVTEQKAKDDYNRFRHDRFQQTLTELKTAKTDAAAKPLFDYLRNELNAGRTKDTTTFISIVVKDNLVPLVELFTTRLQKTESTAEIDNLLELINSIIRDPYDTNSERYIAYRVSEALKPGFTESQKYLGDLLTEGYKKVISERKKIPASPTREDVVGVYEFIISSSDGVSLERNVLLSQIQLLNIGTLSCSVPKIGKVERGWDWSANIDRQNKIPFLMLNKDIKQIVSESSLGETALANTDAFYLDREKSIKLFSYKFNKFSQLLRISRGYRDLIFDDPMLNIDASNPYGPCKMIHHVMREDFIKFPNIVAN